MLGSHRAIDIVAGDFRSRPRRRLPGMEPMSLGAPTWYYLLFGLVLIGAAWVARRR